MVWVGVVPRRWFAKAPGRLKLDPTEATWVDGLVGKDCRPDGTQKRLLEDHQIGWHAGNWEIDCASVGICLAGDYSQDPPPDPAVRSLRELLGTYHGAEVLLHSTVNPKIDCPGEWARGRAWA